MTSVADMNAAQAAANTFMDFIDPGAIDAVVFDIGGVFAIRHPEPIRAGLGRAGFVLPDDPARYHEAHHYGVSALSAGLGTAAAVEGDVTFWMPFERAYFTHLGVAEDDLDSAISAMATEVYAKSEQPVWSGLLPHNITAFHRIANAGIPVAIVSNNDGTAEEQMRIWGVCQVGDGPFPSVAIVVDSARVGIAKPDPAIFTPALEALGTEAGRTLYVGDTVHADVHGAQAAGMPVVQLDPYNLHASFDHARLPDVAALADLLLTAQALPEDIVRLGERRSETAERSLDGANARFSR